MVVLVVVDLALDLADDFGLFGLLGVFVATGWRGESFSAAAAADAATEATPPRVRVDRRVAAVALLLLLLMVALLRIPNDDWQRNEKDCLAIGKSQRVKESQRFDLAAAPHFQMTCQSLIKKV